jgi:hypothetical protein
VPEKSSGRPARTRGSTGGKAKILEAHVRFELDRWSGAGLEQSLTAEVGALFAWLRTVRVDELATPAQVSGGLTRAARAQPAELVRTLERGARVVHEALRQDESTVAELLPRERFDQLVGALIGMREIRQSVIAEIMGSSVYSQLVAHELYHGIKNYILKENVLARRVPGASALLKFGQSTFSSATPGLERGIDRQLESFINANVQDTVRDSQHHLDRTLDAETLWSAAAEFWSAHADEQVATTARRLSSGSLDELVAAVREVWISFCQTPFFVRIVELLVADFFAAHGDKSVDALLADLGITPDLVVRELMPVAAPIVDRARDSGYLESRIRSQLDAFYSAYFQTTVSS